MNTKAIGWAIIVLVLAFSAWNFMGYQEDMNVANETGVSPATWASMMETRRGHVAPRYLEREVLVLGIGLAGWLVFGRPKTSR